MFSPRPCIRCVCVCPNLKSVYIYLCSVISWRPDSVLIGLPFFVGGKEDTPLNSSSTHRLRLYNRKQVGSFRLQGSRTHIHIYKWINVSNKCCSIVIGSEKEKEKEEAMNEGRFQTPLFAVLSRLKWTNTHSTTRARSNIWLTKSDCFITIILFNFF